MTLPRLIEASG